MGYHRHVRPVFIREVRNLPEGERNTKHQPKHPRRGTEIAPCQLNKDTHTGIKQLALASGNGRYMTGITITPRRALRLAVSCVTGLIIIISRKNHKHR